ncbi:hypothetical protein POTOM_009942 [Populus tomentosa]|uniref:Uncharacterized protein n=1 Tax=Populus tomentosa TaxID=118781 RepID=A0A8X8D9Y2_POPTO|nr:hypothetical protein POTOM_009942 [Populus tomentosa]
MATSVFHQPLGTAQPHQHLQNSGFRHEFGHASVKLTFKGFKVETGLSRRGGYSSCKRKFGVIQASASHTSVVQPVSYPPNNSTDELRKKSNMVSHYGMKRTCSQAVEEAIEAGKRISNIPVDMIYTSALIRAQMTAMLAMTQHRRKKVDWYGELQGLNKQETADRFGKEKVHEWRRSYDIPPPNGESLEMCAERAVAYFKDHIEPQLLSGKNVMIAAHGNSLRSIIMYLDKLTSQEVINLELSTGIPMLYILKGGKFIRRGSPAGPTEAGVYAYTRSLALYRQKLDDMLH